MGVLRTWPAWVVLGAVALAFAPALGGGFVWDDVILIRDNAAVHGLGSAWQAAWGDFFGSAGGQPSGGYLRPVPTLLNAATWAAVAADPLVFHLQSLALHLGAVALLMAVAQALGASTLAAAAAGALFGLHPRQVEAVAFISGRTDLLAAVGVLGMTWLHLRARRGGGRAAVAGAWVAFALAVLSKEVALVWPVALAGLEASGRVGEGRTRRTPLFAGYGVLMVAAVAVRLAAGIGSAPRLYFPATDAPVAALSLVGHYAVLLGQPESRALYDHWQVAQISGWTALGAGLLVAAGYATWRLRAHGLAVFGLLVAGLCLAPVLHLVPIPALAAERYLYLPLAGVAWAVAAAVDRVGRRLLAVVGALALAFGALSAGRSLDWRSEIDLWGAEIGRPQASYKAWQNLAVAYAEETVWPDAAGAMLQAQRLRPGDARLLRNAVRITAQLCPPWPERGALVQAALARPPQVQALAQALPAVPCEPVAQAVGIFLNAQGKAAQP